jgi:SAM-dependent methyltransferase
MSSKQPSVAASATEVGYIEAMSRDGVIESYADWTEISDAEARCLDAGFTPGDRVLDLGCGAGRFARRVERLCGGYLGVDASPRMIETARKNLPNLTFEVADIVDCAAPVASYDLVLLMGNVLDYLHPEERRARLLSRCVSWLAADGVVVGSSHLTKPGQARGYHREDYHEASVSNFRCSLSEAIDEVESHGFEIAVAMRDYRVEPADWSYWVARTKR